MSIAIHQHAVIQDAQTVNAAVAAARELYNRERRRLYNHLFPDTTHQWLGDTYHSREYYKAHMRFIQATGVYREIAMMAANRSGKTIVGGYACATWLTGLYPAWWDEVGGRRFDKPVNMWIAGKTNETVRQILQTKMLGKVEANRAASSSASGALKRNVDGTGLVPGELLDVPTWRTGLADMVDTIRVKHRSGDWSYLSFKSYEQGRSSFEGTERDVIWLDEEPPEDVFTECLTRTATTGGLVMSTFTPLEGMSSVAMRYVTETPEEDNTPKPIYAVSLSSPKTPKLPNDDIGRELNGTRYSVSCGWDHVPHLSEETKRDLIASYPIHERDARTKGTPGLGSGSIYPIEESLIRVSPFFIPKHWPRVYGMDVGWNRTAAVWGAWDRDSDTLYIYAEHYMGQEKPPVHVAAIKARGDWIPGVIDPASRTSQQADGNQLLKQYQELGLLLSTAENAREAGIFAVWSRLSSGRLKIFSCCQNLLHEYKFYRRDEKGRIIKQNDHALDALRYLVMSGLPLAITEPEPDQDQSYRMGDRRAGY